MLAIVSSNNYVEESRNFGLGTGEKYNDSTDIMEVRLKYLKSITYSIESLLL